LEARSIGELLGDVQFGSEDGQDEWEIEIRISHHTRDMEDDTGRDDNMLEEPRRRKHVGSSEVDTPKLS